MIAGSEWGSPPRVRGKAESFKDENGKVRITPACAGKRAPFQKKSTPGRDHPRVCGEKQRTLAVQDEPQGSPPRVRGKVQVVCCRCLTCGITPACAGKSSALMQRSGTNGDHPRVCGEKRALSRSWAACGGSPPRVRGKVDSPAQLRTGHGITPACAGKRISGSRTH